MLTAGVSSAPYSLAAILITALAATVTTIVIEALAKPRLEVRKDRLLERERRRREFEHSWAQLGGTLGAYAVHADGEIDYAPRRDELERRMFEYAQSCHAAMFVPRLSFWSEAEAAVLATCAALNALQIMSDVGTAPGPRMDFVQESVDPLYDLADDALRTSWWRWRQRAEIRRRVRKVLPEHDDVA